MPERRSPSSGSVTASSETELERLELARAKLEFEREQADRKESYFRRHPGVLITATAVVVSVAQLGLSQLNQGRQGRLALTRFVSENYDLVFSPDAVQRARMRNAMAIAFPADLIDGLLRSAEDAILMTDVMAPIVQNFDRSKSAFDRWLGRGETEVVRDANANVRRLLTENAELLPTEYRPDAAKLIEHYDAWFREYDRIARDSVPDTAQVFVFAGPSGFPFPREAEERLRELYRDLRISVLGTDSTIATRDAGLAN